MRGFYVASQKATALTKVYSYWRILLCVFVFIAIEQHAKTQRICLFRSLCYLMVYAVVYCWICFTSEDDEEQAEPTSNPVFTRYDGGLNLHFVGGNRIWTNQDRHFVNVQIIFNTGSLGVGLGNGAAICGGAIVFYVQLAGSYSSSRGHRGKRIAWLLCKRCAYTPPWLLLLSYKKIRMRPGQYSVRLHAWFGECST